jgi:hypothetical protein
MLIPVFIATLNSNHTVDAARSQNFALLELRYTSLLMIKCQTFNCFLLYLDAPGYTVCLYVVNRSCSFNDTF